LAIILTKFYPNSTEQALTAGRDRFAAESEGVERWLGRES